MDIYQELKRDHREIKAMLRELVNLNKSDEYRFILMPEVRNALVAHGRAEEAVLYHSLRGKGAKASRAALQGVREHIEIETTLLALQAVERVGANWKPLARRLNELVDNHVKVEELKVFGIAKEVFSQQEANKMGQVFNNLRPRLEQRGELRSTVEMLVNLLPPKVAQALLSNARYR